MSRPGRKGSRGRRAGIVSAALLGAVAALLMAPPSSGAETGPSVAAAAATSAPSGCAPPVVVEGGLDGCLRLNQLQVIGTHNSYHVAPTVPSRDYSPALQYSELPVAAQLDLGVRQLEFDVYDDPNGGRWAPRASVDPAWRQPGFKVFHIAGSDTGTHCVLLRTCLLDVRRWSDGHPTHVPVMILIEAKDATRVANTHSPAAPLTMDTVAFDRLEAVLRSIFSRQQLLTPDDVRAGYSTVPEALEQQGWPALRDVTGRMMFVLDNPDWHRTAYLAGHPALEGRVMFTNAPAGASDGGIAEINDPVSGSQAIRSLLAAGWMVRTRADVDTIQARTDSVVRRDAALASGAQWISTDFPIPDPRWTSYHVSLPDNAPARSDPVTVAAAQLGSPPNRCPTEQGSCEPFHLTFHR